MVLKRSWRFQQNPPVTPNSIHEKEIHVTICIF
jgi:hypothetical protein